jgi:hypothetical protein
MRTLAAILVLAGVLILGGCATDLDTTYGSAEPGTTSLNGTHLLRRALSGSAPRTAWVLSDRLQEAELGCLVHVQQDHQPLTPEVQSWFVDWLEDKPGRQVVLILRDGSLGGPLCRTWAAQARREATRAPAGAAALEVLAKRLEDRAAREDDEDARRRLTERQDVAKLGFHLVPGPLREVQGLGGLGQGVAAHLLRVGVHCEAPQGEVLVTAALGDGVEQPLVTAIPCGEGRLVVVAGATGLLDGAQPDPLARRLLVGLATEIRRYRQEHTAPAGTAFVTRLRVHRGEDDDIDVLRLLFATPPVCYVTWHLVAALAIFLLWRNRWLGRRESAPQDRQQRFMTHVRALAGHLRRRRATALAQTELDRWRSTHRLPSPPGFSHE